MSCRTLRKKGKGEANTRTLTGALPGRLPSPYFKEFQKVDVKSRPDVSNASHASIDGTWSTVTDLGEAQNLNLVHFKRMDGLSVEDLTK